MRNLIFNSCIGISQLLILVIMSNAVFANELFPLTETISGKWECKSHLKSNDVQYSVYLSLAFSADKPLFTDNGKIVASKRGAGVEQASVEVFEYIMDATYLLTEREFRITSKSFEVLRFPSHSVLFPPNIVDDMSLLNHTTISSMISRTENRFTLKMDNGSLSECVKQQQEN